MNFQFLENTWDAWVLMSTQEQGNDAYFNLHGIEGMFIIGDRILCIKMIHRWIQYFVLDLNLMWSSCLEYFKFRLISLWGETSKKLNVV
jgi:hypothetical protein